MHEPHRRRIAVARFGQERTAALAANPTRLRAARLNHDGAGMSADALCALAFVSRRTLMKAERDPSSVSAATLRRLAAALDVRVSEIV